MAKQMRITEFVVEGTGVFPVDMLRYNNCYPADGGSVEAINTSLGSWISPKVRDYSVTLRHRDVYAGWSPTSERWATFGWIVNPSKTREWVA